MIRFDTAELELFARQVGSLDKEAAKGYRAGLRQAGELIATDARSRASYSSRIPGSIKVRVRRASVIVEAGGIAAPDAAPLENKGEEGEFRHPVFPRKGTPRDKWTWRPQKARPFLLPAFHAHRDEAGDLIADGVSTAVMVVIR